MKNYRFLVMIGMVALLGDLYIRHTIAEKH